MYLTQASAPLIDQTQKASHKFPPRDVEIPNRVAESPTTRFRESNSMTLNSLIPVCKIIRSILECVMIQPARNHVLTGGQGVGQNDYGARASKDLVVTRGAGFRKEKNKKKRGSYRGGEITVSFRKINCVRNLMANEDGDPQHQV